ncbi:MAG: hypothetical protein A3F17_08390 [Gammaproteobacteria bacterium RIFCSPHIGHO2_12_FULL_41_15]|nr:MAG: hypothetical protein A3F17_08390 [Gammaproteobacteria bacterium RIFCSPHIGHO2_12_FULL_41_15]
MGNIGALTAAPKAHRIKQVVLLFLLSTCASLGIKALDDVLAIILSVHQWVVHVLGSVFASDYIGHTILNVISMTILPFISGGIMAGIYWLIKKETLPYLMEFIWVSWLLLVVTLALEGM